MNNYLAIAGILCFLLGMIHSFLGEYLIFKHKRNQGEMVPSKVGAELKKRHLAIIWVSWHLASIFGWCIGAILIKMSCSKTTLDYELFNFVVAATTYTMFLASSLVLFGTKGKHPGWIVLLIIGVLLYFST